MKSNPIEQMYIIGCDFTPFTHEKWEKDEYDCTMIEYNDRYRFILSNEDFFSPQNKKRIKIIAYKKEDIKLLQDEVNRLNKFYVDSKEGTYHFYIKKLNSGKNIFKLIPTKTISNFHSFNKKLYGHYFNIKPAKGFTQKDINSNICLI